MNLNTWIHLYSTTLTKYDFIDVIISHYVSCNIKITDKNIGNRKDIATNFKIAYRIYVYAICFNILG